MSQTRERCKYCHGTGTIFPGKTFQAKSKRCPVCKGSCWVLKLKPKEEK